jgi:hypothetical protein
MLQKRPGGGFRPFWTSRLEQDDEQDDDEDQRQ